MTYKTFANLKTFSAVCIVILGEELAVKSLLASVTSEALFVEHFSKGSAAILGQLSAAVVTGLWEEKYLRAPIVGNILCIDKEPFVCWMVPRQVTNPDP